MYTYYFHHKGAHTHTKKERSPTFKRKNLLNVYQNLNKHSIISRIQKARWMKKIVNTKWIKSNTKQRSSNAIMYYYIVFVGVSHFRSHVIYIWCCIRIHLHILYVYKIREKSKHNKLFAQKRFNDLLKINYLYIV